jgi:hypothetical protein
VQQQCGDVWISGRPPNASLLKASIRRQPDVAGDFELAAVYPPVAAQLAELMARIAANDREVAYVNAHQLPEGAKRILVAELVGRGMLGFMNNGVEAPSIVQELRLPAFHHDQHAPYAWPVDATVQFRRIRA